jgi:PAS domain S-box-containing protein
MDPDLDAIVLADPSGRIGYFSAGAERLFGHVARAAVGRSLDLIVPPEFRERHWEGLHRAMRSGESRLDRAAANLPVLCADGQVRVFPGRFAFLTDAHGRPVGALAVYGEAAGDERPFGPILKRA